MRANEIILLNELKMSPSFLQKMASRVPGAQAGIEFEMIVPGKYGDDDTDIEPDYDQDRRAEGIQDIIEFFSYADDGFGNSDRTLNKLEEKLQKEFWEWMEDKVHEDWTNSDDGWNFFLEYFEKNWYDPDNEEGQSLEDAAQDEWELGNRSRAWDDAYDAFREEYQSQWDDLDWCRDQQITMHEIYSRADLQWPYVTYTGGDDMSDIADTFQSAVGRKVEVSGSYHGMKKSSNAYTIEPDSSLEPDDSDRETGLEFVSPPLPIAELVTDLERVVQWARKNHCYTNESTGLHMNVSTGNFSQENLDYVKFALFIGDEYILKEFGRQANSFCKAAIRKIKNKAQLRPDLAAGALDALKGSLSSIAGKLIHENKTDKYTSLNLHDSYVEVRSPGGDWLSEPLDKLTNMLYRITVALDVACDPNKEKEEYAKKLYKLVAVQGEEDITQLFAQFASGKMDKQGLKTAWADRIARGVGGLSTSDNKASRAIPLANKIMNDPKAKAWWEVGFRNPNYGEITTSDRFVAKTAAEAIGYARTKWQIPSGRYSDDTFVVKRLSAYQEPTVGNMNQQDSNQAVQAARNVANQGSMRWAIQDANTGDVLHTFWNRTDQGSANEYARNWLTQNNMRIQAEVNPAPARAGEF